MDILLSTATNTVTLHPDYNVQDLHPLDAAHYNTFGGRNAFYIHNNFNSFIFNIQYMPFSEGLQINEWYEAQTSLTLLYDTTTYTVKVTNRLQQIQAPYQDLWRGAISLIET